MSRPSKEKRVLAITIDSGTIILSYIALEHTPTTRHAAATYSQSLMRELVQPFPIRSEESAVHMLESALIALDAALLSIHEKMDAPDEIFIILASPWTTTQTRHITQQQEIPFTVTHKLLETAIEKDVIAITAHDLEAFAPLASSGKVIEKNISSIKLNGYETTSPIGQRTRTLEIMLTISVSSTAVVERFTQAVRRYFASPQIRYHSELSVDSIVARDHIIAPDIRSAWVLTVHPGSTDITFVSDSVPIVQRTMPFGTTALLTSIAASLQMTEIEAAHLLKTYADQKLDERTHNKYAQALRTELTAWRKEVERIFDTHVFGVCAPKTAVLIGPEDFLPLLRETIAQSEFLKHICGTTELTLLSAETPALIRTFNPHTNIHSTIASLFINRIVY